jgi:Cas6b C-terminal domain/Cas6b N-terminal domain
MKLPAITARIRTDRRVLGVPALLRGFLGRKQPENVLLHQHLGEGTDTRLVYLYPRVQYRLIDGVPTVTGVAEGIPAVKYALEDLDQLELAGWRYGVVGIDFEECEIELEERDEPFGYRFNSPWLALNQGNYARYHGASVKERRELLGRILIGNILSLCRSFDLVVQRRLTATVDVRPTPVHVKKQNLMGFLGSFTVNFRLGPGLGIGHLVSLGFGEAERVNAT